MTHFVPSLPQYVLILCNTIGTPLDSKYIDIGESVTCPALKVHSALK